MLRDLHANHRSKRSAAIRRRGAVSPESVCSQSSRFMPTTSRFSPCRQMMSEVCTRASWTCAEITARSSASSAINLSWAVTASTTFGLRVFYSQNRYPLLPNRRRSIADPLDRGAAGRQLFLEPLEAAVEMVDAVDHGLAFGGQPRDHERHRGAQIGRHHRRAAQH